MQVQVKTEPQSTLPPIVLLVADDPDTRELYGTALGMGGLWVAQARDGNDALDYAIDLKPDAVVMDVGLPTAAHGISLAQQLRNEPRLSGIPIVAVTGLAPESFAPESTLFDVVFAKPVELERLVRRLRWLLAKSAVLRDRSQRARDKVPELLAKSDFLRQKSARLVEGINKPLPVRQCPVCRQAMTFSERRRLEGVLFDYYAPCRKGCGLFCYDHSRRKLITLID